MEVVQMSGDGGSDSALTSSDGRIILRPWSRGDALFLAESNADPAIRRYNGAHDRLGRPAEPPSVPEAERTIDEFVQNWRAFETSGVPAGVAFAVTEGRSGALVGCCGVDHWTGEDVAQFGYWIAPGARGHGYATRAVGVLSRWLFELGAARIALTIVAGNEGSIAVARRAGFVYEGTMRSHSVWQGQRCDVMMFGALATEWQPPAGI
jgi:RimJ/RimL family protein N-acetyltransferase